MRAIKEYVTILLALIITIVAITVLYKSLEENCAPINEDAGYDYYYEVATSKYTPSEILECIAKGSNRDAVMNVLANPKTPFDILADFSTEFPLLVAENPSTPFEILMELSENADPIIRLTVGLNPSTPVGILRELAKDEQVFIREAVAQNPETPIEVLENLKKDDLNTPPEVLFMLTKQILETLATNGGLSAAVWIAKHNNTPVEAIYELERLPKKTLCFGYVLPSLPGCAKPEQSSFYIRASQHIHNALSFLAEKD